ncbi:hypothetical protein EOD39_11280 [Acipenser ruthenus]|uniref:Uncharacterized protein n=1 Tax=Acipenser ruthenus TaxID=7906 RepID=A0A444UPE6_ACIRT|nr:hypothetical protein EOD39_11280 [Acipenser ruthenus]
MAPPPGTVEYRKVGELAPPPGTVEHRIPDYAQQTAFEGDISVYTRQEAAILVGLQSAAGVAYTAVMMDA